MNIHPYFIDKARRWMCHVGGRPQDAMALAAWAQEAHDLGDRRRGVIVAQDGTLVAHTHEAVHLGVYSVLVDSDDLVALTGRAEPAGLGLALDAIRHATGQPVGYASYRDMCQGAGVPRSATAEAA